MELSFAATGWLAGLSALLVPVLLHWLASQQQTPSRFAPMRFLQNLAAEQRGRRLSEWLLLLLRLLLLTLVVLALAGPSLQIAVTRTQSVSILHPALPAGAAEAATYRLCAGADLQPANLSCQTPAADRFLVELQQVIHGHPEWASVTVQVPPQFSMAPLALPELPVRLHWQIVPVDSAATGLTDPPWLVLASDDDWAWFAAGNAVRATPRWQRTGQAENADVVVSVDSPDGDRARVWWHAQSTAWKRDQEQGLPLDYHVAGRQLQLRWPGNDSVLAAVLLDRSEGWLRRGQWQAPINPELLNRNQPIAPQASRHLDLTSWLLLAALLCWLLERRLAHGRR